MMHSVLEQVEKFVLLRNELIGWGKTELVVDCDILWGVGGGKLLKIAGGTLMKLI